MLHNGKKKPNNDKNLKNYELDGNRLILKFFKDYIVEVKKDKDHINFSIYNFRHNLCAFWNAEVRGDVVDV